MMTYKETIKLSLVVWKWLRDHPTLGKEESPYWKRLKGILGNCLLCRYHCDKEPYLTGNKGCKSCILYQKDKCSNTGNKKQAFWIWFSSRTIWDSGKREKAAGEIVDVLQAEYGRVRKEETENDV